MEFTVTSVNLPGYRVLGVSLVNMLNKSMSSGLAQGTLWSLYISFNSVRIS